LPLIERRDSFAQAVEEGAMALFGEKHDHVRAIKFGESMELEEFNEEYRRNLVF
jgi:mannose/fructose-specific phosphotransferase system component IIA